MSELKPLVLLPLPEGHVLRKEVDWVNIYGGIGPANASAGLVVGATNSLERIGYTTYDHWPEGVECPWVVRMNEVPSSGEWPAACGVSGVTREGPDEPGEGWRFLAPEEMPIKGDEFWSCNEWCPSHNWLHNESQAPWLKYRRRVEPSVPSELDRLKSQCERQAETIRELELLTADRKQSVKDHVHYVIDFNQPSQSELQAKTEALELLAAEYKARCEQLQDRNTELRKQNGRQITMVREEFARSSELRSSAGVLRWERRVPTAEECRTRYYLTSQIDGTAWYVWHPEEADPDHFGDNQRVCILPDILPAINPPKTVTERLWFHKPATAWQVWNKRWLSDDEDPGKSAGTWHRTDTVRERVVK